MIAGPEFLMPKIEHFLLDNETESVFEESKPLQLSIDYFDSDNLDCQSTTGSKFEITSRNKAVKIPVKNSLKKKKRMSSSKSSNSRKPQSSKVCENTDDMMELHCPKCIKDLSLKDIFNTRNKTKKCKICYSRIRYYCKKCNHMLDTRSGIQRHIELQHGEPKYFQCAHCTYRTYWKIALIKHLSRIHGFVSNANIYSPLENFYSMMRLHCPKCNKDLSTIDTVFIKGEPKNCRICNSRIKYGCKKCSHTFFSRYSAQRHLWSERGNIKYFNCPHCPYKTYWKHVLKRHIAKRH